MFDKNPCSRCLRMGVHDGCEYAVLKYAIDGLLNAIASIPIGQQKRKPEPRAVKRRPKPYSLLKQPRNKAREAINS